MIDCVLINKLQDFTSVKQLSSLKIEVPNGLFYYVESLNDGNEHQLENKKVTIDFIGDDERDSYVVNIKIKENSDTSDILNNIPNQYPI